MKHLNNVFNFLSSHRTIHNYNWIRNISTDDVIVFVET